MKRLLLTTAVLGSLGTLVSAHAASADEVTCRHMTVPVALAPGQPESYSIAGELCATEDELVTGATLQLLIQVQHITTITGISARSMKSDTHTRGT